MVVLFERLYICVSRSSASNDRSTSRADDEEEDEEILGSDDDEQEDPKDYCKGIVTIFFW